MAEKILVVGPSWVGDMVMAQSLFKVLRQQYPDCLIDVLAPEWSLPLLERMPEVNDGIVMTVGHGRFGWRERRALGRSLADRQYTWSIVLPNSWKSALVPAFAGIPRRTGYFGELRWGLLNDVHKLDKQLLPRTVQRFVALAYPAEASKPPACPVPALIIPEGELAKRVEKFAIDCHGQMVIGLCPGAEYGPAKRWPAEHYAEVARYFLEHGCQVWLFGSGKDTEVCEAINRDTEDRCHNFSGQTSLAEAVDLMSMTDLVISNDSGLMHVAAALDRKLIAIYGSSDPGFTPPLHDKSRILTLGLDCSPCFQRECPLTHYRCLTDITPEQVLAEAQKL